MWPISIRGAAVLLLPLLTACATGGLRDPSGDATVDAGASRDYAAALVLLEAGEDDRAATMLGEIAADQPGLAGPFANLALIEARRNRLDEAARLLAEAGKVCTNCAPVWNELGVVERRRGQFAAAEAAYRQALAADATFADARINLAVLYELYLQRPELALEQYVAVRASDSESPLAADVDKRIADLQRRAKPVERSAQLEAAL